jgi:hypothetical protein
MDSEPTLLPTRSEALRAHLVATASAQSHDRMPAPRRWMSRRRAALALGVFALAGALAGGAVSATAINAANSPTVTVSIDDMKEALVGEHTPLFGTPLVYSGQGDAEIDLGDMPEEASMLAVVFYCVDEGSFTTYMDGLEQGTDTCEGDDLPRTNSGSFAGVESTGDHILTIEGSGSDRYVIWAQWANRPQDPEYSSAQVAAMADGAVTREEYDAGFQRFYDCMADQGFPVLFIDRSRDVISYSTTSDAASDGADMRCYIAEFEDVDGEWQVAHEDTSQTADWIRGCLINEGVLAEDTLAEMFEQLEDISLTPEGCP